MTILPTIFSLDIFIDPPNSLTGWIGLILLFCLALYLQWRWRKLNRRWGRSQFLWFFLLLLATILANLLIGVQLPAGQALPPPDIPADQGGPVAMIFSAIPWTLAAGLLGPLAAAILALVSGLVRALWETHHYFSLIELVLLATFISVAVRQRYRTLAYRLLRDPLIAALLASILYLAIFLITTFLIAGGELVNRIDYALSNLVVAALAVGIELLAGGLAAEVVARVAPKTWGDQEPIFPSPAEKSLHIRILYNLAPLALVLILTLMIGDWVIAGRTASEMWKNRMADAAVLAAETVPYFLESGQQLITELANEPTLLSANTDSLTETLQAKINNIPYFNQLILLDDDGETIAAYPSRELAGKFAPPVELIGVGLALTQNIPVQTYTIPPAAGRSAAQVSFVAGLAGRDGNTERVLVGRTYLDENPMMRSILASLNSLAENDGQGMLLDEEGQILVHPNPARLMEIYTVPSSEPDGPIFYREVGLDGKRRLVYYLPARGRPWAIVLTVPASYAQQRALDIAGPLLGMIVILAAVSVVVLRLRLTSVTSSLQNLAHEAGRLADGKLDSPLVVVGDDEVGQFRRAFERMRVSLKDRLDELNSLLLVSQGVASTLEVSEAVQPVLESALATGANAARVVLAPAAVPELDGDSSTPTSFGMGPSQERYQVLDDQILAFTRQQNRLVQSNVSRPRLLNFAPGMQRPSSLMAVALRHENQYYGALWAAYDQPHSFTEEEVRFLTTLGGHAALAAANAHLFQKAEIGRQRLAAILDSSPDPILVIDQQERLLLANPAAWQALGLGTQMEEGKPIEDIITQNDLLDLLRYPSDEKQSKEIILPDGKIYLAAATPVLADGQRVGRICIMQDVTHFKELDSLKSEFVSTVSHDLRSPLTLMRGYATMLEMVGQLNEQQTNYVRKIVTGVESMSRLVTNLLDLGRIEAGVGAQLEMIPIHDVVESVTGALQLQATQKRIQLTTEIPQQTIPLIEADPALLQQALHNLVENAIKYTEPEGKVKVRVQAGPLGMVFEIQDTGIGVSPMDQQRLFEKFYRGAHQGTKAQQGTGLGLAIVKSIAERHSGRVWADSQLGKGSTFYLAIPLRQPLKEK